MMMVELTSVPSAALPIAALSDHLRLSSGFADDGSQDAQLESCIRSALAAIEARINKALFQRQFMLTLVVWATDESHPMPVAPVVSIDDVTMISQDGETTAVDPASYYVQPDTHRPRLTSRSSRLPAPGTGGTVEVTFTAGFSPNWAEIPADLNQALLGLAAEFYNLEASAPRQIPLNIMGLLEPYRQLRLRGGAV